MHLRFPDDSDLGAMRTRFEYVSHRYKRINSLDELRSGTSFCPVDQQRDLGVFLSDDFSCFGLIRASSDKARMKAYASSTRIFLKSC